MEGEVPMKFADKLEKLRKTRGLSQESIAEKCHVSRQAVSKWESGNSLPDIDNLILIGELFGVSLDYLVNDKIEEVIPLAPINYITNSEDGIINTVLGKWCIIHFNLSDYSFYRDEWKVHIVGYDNKYFFGRRILHGKLKWCIIRRKSIKSFDLTHIPAHKKNLWIDPDDESNISFDLVIEKLSGKKCIFGPSCDLLTRLFLDGNEIKGTIESYDYGMLNIRKGKKIRIADITNMVYLSEL
jgi:transcriptional regulator with XRE-family HTH domain